MLTLLIHSITESGQCYLINIFLIHNLILTLILYSDYFFIIFIFIIAVVCPTNSLTKPSISNVYSVLSLP